MSTTNHQRLNRGVLKRARYWKKVDGRDVGYYYPTPIELKRMKDSN